MCAVAILLGLVQTASAKVSFGTFDLDVAKRDAAANGHKYVYAKVEKTSVSHDANSTLSVDSGWVYTQKGGKRAIYAPENTAVNLYLKPNTDYWSTATNSRAAVTIEYFDSVGSSFSLMYSSEESDNGYATFR